MGPASSSCIASVTALTAAWAVWRTRRRRRRLRSRPRSLRAGETRTARLADARRECRGSRPARACRGARRRAAASGGTRPRSEGPCCCDDLVDVRQLAPELPNMADRLAVLDQERGALGDAGHPQELRRDAECPRRLPVPVGEERHVLRAERLRPGLVGPRRVAGDRERTDPDRSQILAPVPQEQNLVGSGRRPVPEVEGEERQARAEHVPEGPRLLACPHPRPGHQGRRRLVRPSSVDRSRAAVGRVGEASLRSLS